MEDKVPSVKKRLTFSASGWQKDAFFKKKNISRIALAAVARGSPGCLFRSEGFSLNGGMERKRNCGRRDPGVKKNGLLYIEEKFVLGRQSECEKCNFLQWGKALKIKIKIKNKKSLCEKRWQGDFF